MILPIYTYGQPVLRKIAQDIPLDYEGLPELIQNMFETMAESDGIGLAAPQIGKDIRVVVIDLDVLAEDFPEYKGFHKAFINAHIIEKDEENTEAMEEGCLSLPGIHENVTRIEKIHLKWQDENFQVHEQDIEGYLARVVQHECDHLDGKVFIDHISSIRKQLINNKLKKIVDGKIRCTYRTRAVKK